MRTRRLVLAVLGVLVSRATPVHAHTDTVFPISPSGTLLNFPEKYGPPSVTIVRFGSRSEPDRRPEVVVAIGPHTTELPMCVAHLFMQPPNKTIRASGSWYHQRSVLPPYLNIEIPYRESEHHRFDGYSLLFNIESGQLIEIRIHKMGSDGLSEWSSAISEVQACKEDLFGTFSEPRD